MKTTVNLTLRQGDTLHLLGAPCGRLGGDSTVPAGVSEESEGEVIDDISFAMLQASEMRRDVRDCLYLQVSRQQQDIYGTREVARG